MKKTALYLIPVTFMSNGKTPLQYRVIAHKVDRRFTFVRKNESRIYLPAYMAAVKNHPHTVDGEYITLQDGTAAALLYRDLRKAGYK